jgi:hypothetical protein
MLIIPHRYYQHLWGFFRIMNIGNAITFVTITPLQLDHPIFFFAASNLASKMS